MSFNTLSAILRGVWLMDRGYAQMHLPIIHGILTGKSNGAELLKGSGVYEQPFAYSNGKRIDAYRQVYNQQTFTWDSVFNEDLFPDDSIFVIPSIGPVMKYAGDCGEPGNVQRQGWANDFANSNQLTGLISFLDTPGGQADGTPQYADFIKNIDKPKIALVDNAYSAGAWNASAHDKILLTSDFAGFGGIGAYTTFPDFSGYFKKLGIKVTDVYPEESSEKNADYRAAMKGNFEPLRENVAELAQSFIDTFADNRPGKMKSSAWEKGASYNAKDAVEMGLVDGLGSFDDAAAQLGAKTSKKTKSTFVISTSSAAKTSISQSTNMKYPKLTALLTALQGGTVATQEELDMVNAELAEGGITGVGLFPESLVAEAAETTNKLGVQTAEVTRLTAELGTATTNLATANGKISTLTAEKTVLEAKIAKAPAAAAAVVGAADPDLEKTDAQKAQEKINSLPHNQGILTNPLFMK